MVGTLYEMGFIFLLKYYLDGYCDYYDYYYHCDYEVFVGRARHSIIGHARVERGPYFFWRHRK